MNAYQCHTNSCDYVTTPEDAVIIAGTLREAVECWERTHPLACLRAVAVIAEDVVMAPTIPRIGNHFP